MYSTCIAPSPRPVSATNAVPGFRSVQVGVLAKKAASPQPKAIHRIGAASARMSLAGWSMDQSTSADRVGSTSSACTPLVRT